MTEKIESMIAGALKAEEDRIKTQFIYEFPESGIAKTVAAERERCIKIAKFYADAGEWCAQEIVMQIGTPHE